MLASLIRFSLSQRLLILLLAAGIAGFGYYSVRHLPVDAFPDISPTQVKIIIKAPGMTPEEVESRITVPVELELLGIPRQTILRSMAKYGLADITLDFEEGTDIYWARQQIAERLNSVWGDLPDTASGGLAPMSTPLSEMFMFTVEGDGYSLAERRHLLDWVIRPALRTVPGVADVNALGGYVRTFEIAPRPQALAATGVTIADIAAAVQGNNRNDGAGRVVDGSDVLLVRIAGRVTSLADLVATPVPVAAGGAVRLGDIADVRMGSVTRYGAVTKDGKGEAVEGLVIGLRGANAREVVAGVQAKLDELKPSLPQGIDIKVFYNRSELVQRAVGMVMRVLLEATVLVMVLLALFLGQVSSALTVAAILPLAALITFIVMRSAGMSANLMSLGGLAIAIGMLVDAAVVVVENVVKRLAEPGATGRLPRLHIIYRAVREVARPVVSGIAIIIIVFFPLLALQGLEGKLFRPVALTIVFALTASLLLALTVIPVIASFLLRHPREEEPWLPRQLAKHYRRILGVVMVRRKWVLAAAGALGVAAIVAFMAVGKAFMPTMDEGDIIVQLEKVPSISLADSIAIDRKVEQALLANVPEIDHIVARSGSDELGMDPMGLNETDMFTVLKPPSEWRDGGKAALIERIRAVMEQFDGVNFGFTQPIEMRVAEMLTGSRGDLAVKIFGDDIGTLNRLAGEVAGVLEQTPGSSDVFTSLNEGARYLVITPRREAMGRFGLSVDDTAQLLRGAIEGLPLGIVVQGAARVPLQVRFDQPEGDPRGRLGALPVTLPNGSNVPLSAVADIEMSSGPVSVRREDGRRFTVVRSNVEGRDLVGFVDEARAKIANEVKLPAGYHVTFGGQFENQQRAAARLALVIPVALTLIFLLLFVTFGSLRQASLVFLNVPLALSGGALALWLSGEYLSVPASVGFIALLGIAVLNGVVLISHFNQLRERGMPIAEVVITGSVRRLRPVLMTASIAALGLVPFLFASGPGSEIQRPLAVVVIGGLLSSTLLTLLLLPIAYRHFEGRRS